MTVPAGSIRFNTDSSKMEIYNGDKWWNIDSTSPAEQTGGTRGFFAGGRSPTYTNIIDYINVDTTGNALDFGDLLAARIATGGCASRTRGVIGGGYETPTTYINTIEYVDIATTGNAINFGDLTTSRAWLDSTNDSTRGLWGGSWGSAPATSNVIDYVTIASTGDAVDFGDLTIDRQVDGSCQSPTRSIWLGGARGSGPQYEAPSTGKTIDYVTTSTLGNASDFGDLITGTFGNPGSSNAVRGLSFSGFPGITSIEYITMATLGDAKDFGDLSEQHYYGGAVASPTRAASGAGNGPGTATIEYVQIATTANAVDFGDLTQARVEPGTFSNGNGGLG